MLFGKCLLREPRDITVRLWLILSGTSLELKILSFILFEAMRRIKNKLCKMARKGVNPVAYCGLSCNHCFLGQWCGACRTEYNTCSFAPCSQNGECPNAKCCKEKGFDGCWECSEIESCQKGFYNPECDGANAAKAQALFIGKYGKKEFLKMQEKYH